MVTTTQSLSDDMIELFAAELHASVRLVDPGEEKEAELQAKYFDDEEEDEALLRPRPPVVTVMGHVDHGKTLLLDRIRQTNVVAGEAGGITQHIGAYQVDYHGQLITFIDTPGHEAFTAMRARGAEVTDIVILVVAADDGVMPQTVEAINHAKGADVPIIVAINKIDRDNADPNRVMQQLSDQGLVPEAWGGDTIMVEISALQNFGIDDLLEQVLLVAEVEELVANPEGRGRGIVLEANLDPGKGPVATVIVQSGTLRVSDSVVAGAAWGRVKALLDDSGDNVKEASPSTPVQLLGFDTVPSAGDEFRVTDKAKTARDIAEQREQRFRAADQRRTSSATGTGAKLEDIFEQIQRGETATLNLVLKADTQGSLEAVTESLRKLEREEVKLSFIHRAVGGISENDVTFAAASNATIIGFNVRPDRGARELAEVHDVEIRTYEIIYQLIEDIESAMVGMLAPEFEEVITGRSRGPRDLPGAEGRRHRRMPGPPRCHHPRLQGSFPPRRGHHLEGRHHVAQAVQGGRPRGARGLRVRYRPVQQPGSPRGGRHRDVRSKRDPAHLRLARCDARRIAHRGASSTYRALAQGEAGGAASNLGRIPPALCRRRCRGRPPGPVAAGHARHGHRVGIRGARPAGPRRGGAFRVVVSRSRSDGQRPRLAGRRRHLTWRDPDIVQDGGRRTGDGPARHYPRAARVNQILHEVLADALERLADTDERLGLLTITAVECDPDLRRALVLFSSLDDEGQDILAEARVRLQLAIAQQVRLKRTPLLRFAPDPAVAAGRRVEDILRELPRLPDDPAPPDDDGTGP